MILAFLKAEVDSPRFARCFLPSLTQSGFTRLELIDKADLKDERQNSDRRTILRAYRGFGRNALLFRGFPEDVVWRRVEIEPSDHSRLRFASEPTWIRLSDGTRLVTRLAEKVALGEIPSDPADHVKGIQNVVRDGKELPELIAVEGSEDDLILVEGHCRATAYVALQWKENIRMFLGQSPAMRGWCFY